MAKSKKAKNEAVKSGKLAPEKAAKPPAPVEPEKKYSYQCPACTNPAIETSNKMMGVQVNCQHCGKLITLDDGDRYSKVKK